MPPVLNSVLQVWQKSWATTGPAVLSVTRTYNLKSRQLKFRLWSPFFVNLVQSLNYFEVSKLYNMSRHFLSPSCSHMFCDSQVVLRMSPAYSTEFLSSSTQLTSCFNLIFLPEEKAGTWNYNVCACVCVYIHSLIPIRNSGRDDGFSWHFMCALRYWLTDWLTADWLTVGNNFNFSTLDNKDIVEMRTREVEAKLNELNLGS